MISKLKRAVINTPLQPVAEAGVLHPIARIRGLLKPDLRQMYEDDIHLDRAFNALIEPHFNCMDIGCHIGSVLAKFVRLAPQGRHIGVEPTPAKAAFLRQKFPGVRLHEIALSDRRGQAQFFINDKEPGYNSLTQNSAARASTSAINVAVDTLDNLLADNHRIDLMKVDVEGAELSVLKGAQKFFGRCRPFIVFESGPAISTGGDRFEGDNLFEFLTGPLQYDIFSPKQFLDGAGAMCLEKHRAHRTYPFGGFNFVAQPRSPTAASIG